MYPSLLQRLRARVGSASTKRDPRPEGGVTGGAANSSSFFAAGTGKVMLSYSWGSKDPESGVFPNQQQVLAIRDGLERRGIACWIDTEEMRGNMTEVMTTVIANCNAVVVCMSPTYCRSGSNSLKEFNYAVLQKRRLLGAKTVPGTDMISGAYGFHMGSTMYYDLSHQPHTPEFEQQLTLLARDLKMVPMHSPA